MFVVFNAIYVFLNGSKFVTGKLKLISSSSAFPFSGLILDTLTVLLC